MWQTNLTKGGQDRTFVENGVGHLEGTSKGKTTQTVRLRKLKEEK